MSNLTYLNDASVLHNLKQRYYHKLIYVSCHDSSCRSCGMPCGANSSYVHLPELWAGGFRTSKSLHQTSRNTFACSYSFSLDFQKNLVFILCLNLPPNMTMGCLNCELTLLSTKGSTDSWQVCVRRCLQEGTCLHKRRATLFFTEPLFLKKNLNIHSGTIENCLKLFMRLCVYVRFSFKNMCFILLCTCVCFKTEHVSRICGF